MQLASLVGIALAMLAAHFVGSLTAYGSNLIALPLLVLITNDPRICIVAILILGALQSYQVGYYTYRDADWREYRRILFWAGCGMPIGYFCQHVLPQKPLLLALGCVVLIAGISRLRTVSRDIPIPLLRLLLFIGGIIHGAFVCGGATMIIYAQQALKKKETFRGTMCMVWASLNTVLLIMNAFTHSYTIPVGRLALTGLPFVLIGNWLGELGARRIRQRRFTQLLSILLVAAGVLMILRNIN